MDQASSDQGEPSSWSWSSRLVQSRGREEGGGRLAQEAVGGVEVGGGGLEVASGGVRFAPGLPDGLVGGGLLGAGGVLVPLGAGDGGEFGGGAVVQVGCGEVLGVCAPGDVVVGVLQGGALLDEHLEDLGLGAFALLFDGLAFGGGLE